MIGLGGTRGVWLGVAAGLGLGAVVVAAARTAPPSLRRAAGGLLIAAVLAGAAVALAPEAMRDRTGLSRLLRAAESESAAMRVLTWRSALRGFAERPLLGWGHDGAYYVLNRFYDPSHVQFNLDFRESRVTWYDKSHNAYIDLLVEKGIAGALAFLLLALVIARRLARLEDRPLALALAAGFTGCAAANAVAFDTFGSLFGAFLFLIVLETARDATRGETAHVQPPAATPAGRVPPGAKRASRGQDRTKGRPPERNPVGGPRLAAFAVVACVLALAIYGNGQIGLANARCLDAQRYFAADPDRGIAAYRAAFGHPSPYNAKEKLDCAYRIANAAVNGRLTRDREAAIGYAVELAGEAARAHPLDAAFHMVLNDLYNTLAIYRLWDGPALDLAEESGRRALELSPKRQEAMIYLGRTYILRKEPERAVALNREMIAAYPGFPLARWLLGLSLVEAGRREEGKREVRAAFADGYKYQNAAEAKFVRELFNDAEYLDLMRGRPAAAPGTPQ